jgi:hypothetical protein
MSFAMATRAIAAPPTEMAEKAAGSSHHHGTESNNGINPVGRCFIDRSFAPTKRTAGEAGRPDTSGMLILNAPSRLESGSLKNSCSSRYMWIEQRPVHHKSRGPTGQRAT